MTVFQPLFRVLTLAGMVWVEMLRRKDMYVLLILLVFLLGYLLSVPFFESVTAHRYIAETGMFLAWMLSWILTIQLTGRQLPSEERAGTIFPLLVKPVRRWEVLVGKWLGGWSASSMATAVFYLAVGTVVAWRGGPVDPALYGQGYLLHIAMLSILAAMTLMWSTKLTAEAAMTLSYLFAAICFIIVPKASDMLVFTNGAARVFVMGLYYGLPHFEFFDLRLRIVHGWGLAPWPVAIRSLAYAAIWTGALLLAAEWMYRNKILYRSRAA